MRTGLNQSCHKRSRYFQTLVDDDLLDQLPHELLTEWTLDVLLIILKF